MQGQTSFTNRDWYDGLKQEDKRTETSFYRLVVPMINAACRKYQLLEEETEEVIIYALLTTIRHIQNGRYQFQEYAPSTYTVSIAKWKAWSTLQKRAKVVTSYSHHQNEEEREFDTDFYTYLEKNIWQNEQFLEAFQQLAPDCQTIVEAYYNEGLKDSEIATNSTIPQNNRINVNRRKGVCIEKLKQLLRNTDFFE